MLAYGLLREDVRKIQRIPAAERVPSECGRFFETETPKIKADEVLIKVVSAGLNYNSIWSTTCHPIDPFSLISGHIRRNPKDRDHLQDFAIFGSDAAGIIVEVGPEVAKWKEGDEVIVHCNVVDQQEELRYPDEMTAKSQSIWGYETNFGAFAEFCKVKANQLIARPKSLSWPQAGSFCLTLSTAYRMLLSPNGAQIKEGENCLIWGGAGGLGAFAIQLVNHAGAKPVAVVSNEEKEKYCLELGCSSIINRSTLDIESFVDEKGEPDYLAWRKFSKQLDTTGINGIDVVFEHIGRETLSMSIYLLNKGGRVVTCAATSGYLATIDLRYLWMEVKRLIGSHFATAEEAVQATELISSGIVQSTSNTILDFEGIPSAMDMMYSGKSMGKIAFNVGTEDL